MSARTIIAVHLAVFAPLIAVCAAFAGPVALEGGSLAFALVLGLNLLLWRIT